MSNSQRSPTSDDQNPQAHHRAPYNVRISYVEKRLRCPRKDMPRRGRVYFALEKETFRPRCRCHPRRPSCLQHLLAPHFCEIAWNSTFSVTKLRTSPCHPPLSRSNLDVSDRVPALFSGEAPFSAPGAARRGSRSCPLEVSSIVTVPVHFPYVRGAEQEQAQGQRRRKYRESVKSGHRSNQ